MIDWNSAPKMAGLIALQSSVQQSISASRILRSNDAMGSASWNSLPLTYGNAASCSSSVFWRAGSGVFSTWNSSAS